MEKKSNLRKGHTTGSCATAAAKAATTMLFSGINLMAVKITLPKGETLNLEIIDSKWSSQEATCAVFKDSGDDPDVTNQMLIYATVSRKKTPGIEIEGGVGIGRVTKTGLSTSVGRPAINPVPLKMIQSEVEFVCNQYGYEGGLKVLIFAPKGEEVAKRTFNGRLGILGGISILGTTGIVEPMSEAAIVETIRIELLQKIEIFGSNVIACPGNYGEAFIDKNLRTHYQPVLCSNFIGELLDFARIYGVTKLLLVGHAGKLVKLAAGIMNTHSKVADGRMEILAAHAAAEGASASLTSKILEAITTEEATVLFETVDGLKDKVFQRVVEKMVTHMSYRVHHEVEIGVILFNNKQEILGQSGNVAEMLKSIQNVK